SIGAGTQYVWSSWSDGGGVSHTVAPGSNITYTANFTTQHFLTMNAGAGGTVSPGSGFFNSGQSVTITATANALFTFSGWTGSGAGSFTGTANPAIVTLNGPVTESSTFTAAPQWQPVVLTAQQINQIKAWTVGGRTYVYVKPQFPDAGYRVV